MTLDLDKFENLAANGYGAILDFSGFTIDPVVRQCEKESAKLLKIFYRVRGLMVLRGMRQIRDQPEALLRLSRIFGDEVENYHQALTSSRFFHQSVPEILVLTDLAPCNHLPPALPDCQTADYFPLQFPDRPNWHTDQSYRRPPPDISLLFGVKVTPPDQGQTLYADCTRAYKQLDQATRKQIDQLEAIHAPSWIGGSRNAVESGQIAQSLLPHQLPQKQPIVRIHPVTGEPALYLCEEKQLDYVDGPIHGMVAGPNGEGAKLLRMLLSHATQQKYCYVHSWQAGDLIIGDNRNQLHCATWYHSKKHSRLMWRTTVMGNPGEHYRGEEKSWIPKDGEPVMQGMEHA